MTTASARAQDWAVPVVRGALALAATAAITFSQDHSPAMGLLVFGIWAVVAGVVVGALSLRFVADRTTRTVTLVSANVTAVAGLLALTLPAGLPFFLTLVSAWAAITGFLELYLGLRGRDLARAPDGPGRRRGPARRGALERDDGGACPALRARRCA